MIVEDRARYAHAILHDHENRLATRVPSRSNRVLNGLRAPKPRLIAPSMYMPLGMYMQVCMYM